MSEQPRDRPLAGPRLAKVLMTLGAWLVAFVIVLALLTLLGDELKSLPLALRALLISGVLVSLMVNLVMPVLSMAIARWLTGGPMSGLPRDRARARVGQREHGRDGNGPQELRGRDSVEASEHDRPEMRERSAT